MSQPVLFVVGEGRSGSTLLARLLGEIPGYLNVGECARYLIDRNMFAMNLPCSCGQSPFNCPFWSGISGAVTDSDRDAAWEILRLRHMLPWSRARHDERREGIRDSLVEVYRRVARESGCRVIVDSSKHPAPALLLSSSEDIELHVVHLVRDPRAVVSSRSAAKSYLKKWNPLLVVARWLGFNAGSETLVRHASSYRRVRYEEFVAGPVQILSEIAEMIGGDTPELGFLNGREATVSAQHALAGNPDKFHEGVLTIRSAGFEISNSKKLLTTLISLPLLIRYRYAIWPR